MGYTGELLRFSELFDLLVSHKRTKHQARNEIESALFSRALRALDLNKEDFEADERALVAIVGVIRAFADRVPLEPLKYPINNVRFDRQQANQVFKLPCGADPSVELRPAPAPEVEKAVRAVYAGARKSGSEPPDINELHAAVLLILECGRYTATRKAIMDVGEHPLTDDDWKELEKIAEIRRQREFRAKMAIDVVRFGCQPGGVDVPVRPSAGEIKDLKRAAELTRRLHPILLRCKEIAPSSLPLPLPKDFLGLSISEFTTAVLDFSQAVSESNAAAKGMKGRPPRGANAKAQIIVKRVYRAVAAGGGHLTLIKGKRIGSLLTFLDRLRRHLRNDALPRKHPIADYADVPKPWSRRRAIGPKSG